MRYSLDNLQQFTILSEKYHPTNEDVINSPLWKKEVNGTYILVIKDAQGKIEHVSVSDNNSRSDIVPIHPNNSSSYDDDHIFATITMEDYDEEKINTMAKNHKEAFKSYTETTNKSSKSDKLDIQLLQKSAKNCQTFKVIDIAIAYDSTLCEKFNRDKQQTERHIQALVGMASHFYEPICLKLKISYIDGYCDSSLDPYYKMVRSESILEQFTSAWRSYRSSVQRDAAHLLTGNNFEKGVLGYAFKSTLCTKEDAFGANYLTWTDNIALRASLFGKYTDIEMIMPHLQKIHQLIHQYLLPSS